MLLDLLLIAAGIGVLAYSGHLLVDFAAALAEKARLTPAVVGLTVVAAGTSMPELFVSLTAGLRGSPDIALGNVVGSNIANIGVILGACALAVALPVGSQVLRFEYPFMLLASWVAFLLCRDGVLDRLEGGFFTASMAAFLAYSVWLARQEVAGAEARGLVPPRVEVLEKRPAWALGLGVAGALLGLGLGARMMVAGAVDVARLAGLSERVVGLTIVAVGTSLPELVASGAAALKRHHDMAVANIVGSNIFNLLMILGLASLVAPIPVSPQIITTDFWVMLAFAVLLLPLVAWDRALSRRDGAVLLAAYAAYVVWLLRQAE